MNFGESLTIQALRHPNKIAIEDDFKSITYKELNLRANRLALGLLDCGLKKGSIVGQFQGNTSEHIELIYALAKTGMIRMPINPRAQREEILNTINMLEPQALVFDSQFAEIVASLKSELKCPLFIYEGPDSFTGAIHYEDLITKYEKLNSEPKIEIEEGDPFFVQSTSGTTGFPKAALLSQGGMIKRSLIRAIDLNNHAQGIYLAVTSLSNTASVFYAISQLYIGGTVILRNKFEPLDILETIEAKKVTNISMVPVMWERILELPELPKFKLDSLQFVISYGAPLHEETKIRMVKGFFFNLYETYGITETGPISNLLPRDQLRKKDCVGQPTLHTRIKIKDEFDNELPIGREGEIVVQTPYLFMGYLKNPEATNQVLRKGWYYTGDIGRLDEEKYLYITGRSKDVIISGGYNIYAEEIERVIALHPKVKEVAVIAVPDEKWGEAVKAIVVLKKGFTATAEEIIEFCKMKIASYKKPQSVSFVSHLPHSEAGKIAKNQLKEEYWAGQQRKVS